MELVGLPYVFSQSPLLRPDQFIRDARERGAFLSEEHLEALHRARVLVPLFRVTRSTRQVRTSMRAGGPLAWQMGYWSPTEIDDVLAARDAGRLHDPAAERFMTRSQREHRVGEMSYASSVYLYCKQQMIHLPDVASALPSIRWTRDGDRIRGRLHAPKRLMAHWTARAAALRDVVIATAALEPPYHNAVYGFTRWRNREGIDDFETW